MHETFVPKVWIEEGYGISCQIVLCSNFINTNLVTLGCAKVRLFTEYTFVSVLFGHLTYRKQISGEVRRIAHITQQFRVCLAFRIHKSSCTVPVKTSRSDLRLEQSC